MIEKILNFILNIFGWEYTILHYDGFDKDYGCWRPTYVKGFRRIRK